MTFNAAPSAFADPTQIWLERSPTELDRTWKQSQSFSTSNSRWNAYLNQICLSAILPWLQEEYDPRACPWLPVAALPSCWEVVNGTAITLDDIRLVLVPSEAMDLSEVRVPQEWVDIPGWTADYYLAVQVNPDEGWVRVWGYCTHQQLKGQGSYDWRDRTYCLDEEDLIADLNVLWVARQLCPDEPTRSDVSPLPTIPVAQAENLLQRLGDSAMIVPRLAVPFELWGALLAHGGWRQRLYQRRLGRQEPWSIRQWLQTGVSELAQQLGWERVEMQTTFEGARGLEQLSASTVLSRQLMIAGQLYELRLLQLSNPEESIWRFELRNAHEYGQIPAGFKLRLLTEDLQPFENNEDIAEAAVDQLYVEVAVEPGEGLVWEVEPTPENYDREILRF